MFDAYLTRWNLAPDGAPIVTHAAQLLPVLHEGAPAMLKVSIEEDEKQGGVLMNWWDGQGAARVLAHDDDAILLERATGTRSLAHYARNGRDDEATRILCGVLKALHAPRGKPLPALRTLEEWFAELWPMARTHGGILAHSARHARALLDDPQDVTVLHGDAHHDNVLDFGERGWLVIDPKRLHGDRAFDYANIFCNPDLTDPVPPVATVPGQFERRLDIIVAHAGLDRRRLLRWVVAWCGLSAAWYMGDGDDAAIDLDIARQAQALLDR
ncbi:Aminoglycoside/hydroxyurea antibiotic resistance kinase [compost metagenome]|uniref:aminoglycoside phosphotransferase family protein n=1 Tax=Achromobacter sp. Root83 TaxID=1736602 RepID=UPI000708AEC4|nr:aminoglycoside phosphotransferase family protein [Achromobacter sp. Root83]KRC70915.1 streptomycin kinase [Achromobacter sp. Root83]